MNDALTLGLAWLAGVALGAVFFGGLWWTVHTRLSSPRAGFWFLGSMLLRMGIVLVGLYLVGDGHWERLLACLLGFVMARPAVTALARVLAPERSGPAEDASHAP